MKICLSIAPNSMLQALKTFRDRHNTSDLIEVRTDGIKDLNIFQLLQQPRPKLIITNRKSDEGGIFRGTAREQFDILSQAIQFGAEYIDIEYSWGEKFVGDLINQSKNTKIICSYHNFRNNFKDPESLYQRMRKTGAHILKIATTAKDVIDNKVIFSLLKQAHRDKQKMIAICMGEAGEISRILGGKYGTYLTYASVTDKDKTADGQLTYDELRNLYRAEKFNSKTKIFGLVGNPVKHSKGIYFHNKIFFKKRLNAVYVNFLVNDLPAFISQYRDLFTGLSVTMPFKGEIVRLIDNIDAESAGLGICNTVINKKNKLKGFNTDLPAIISVLKKRTNLNGKKVAVLGTGATAKTMAFATMRSGCRTTVAGRDPSKAEKLAVELGCEWSDYENLHKLSPDILLNSTPVGMKGNLAQRIVHKNVFKKDMIVFDAVYNPVITPLLQDAIEAGCKIITGLEFFEKQATLQSKLFMTE